MFGWWNAPGANPNGKTSTVVYTENCWTSSIHEGIPHLCENLCRDVTSFGPIRLDQMAGKSSGQSHIWWLTYPSEKHVKTMEFVSWDDYYYWLFPTFWKKNISHRLIPKWIEKSNSCSLRQLTHTYKWCFNMFQPPWKILVSLDHHPNYWGK